MAGCMARISSSLQDYNEADSSFLKVVGMCVTLMQQMNTSSGA